MDSLGCGPIQRQSGRWPEGVVRHVPAPVPAPRRQPPANGRRWGLLWVDGWACLGRPIGQHRMPSGCIGQGGGGGRPRPPHRPPPAWLPAPLRVAVDVQKIGMEFFFFFFPEGGPNRIRSGAKIGVFFCQGCQSRRSDPTRREFVEKRCYFFSRGKIFGKNADITAINDGFLSVFHGGGVR